MASVPALAPDQGEEAGPEHILQPEAVVVLRQDLGAAGLVLEVEVEEDPLAQGEGACTDHLVEGEALPWEVDHQEEDMEVGQEEVAWEAAPVEVAVGVVVRGAVGLLR